MKKLTLLLLTTLLTAALTHAQQLSVQDPSARGGKTEEVKYRHSIGASLWMLANFSKESAEYYLLTYGYRLTAKDRIFVEYNTWKYEEPMGTYGDSDELYPGFIRSHGVGFGYQRFIWRGLFSSAQATPFFLQYFDEQDDKIQNGFQLYLQWAVGYRLAFFNQRWFVEPAYAIKYWPVNTNVPASFEAIDEGTPGHKFEPSLNFGFRF